MCCTGKRQHTVNDATKKQKKTTARRRIPSVIQSIRRMYTPISIHRCPPPTLRWAAQMSTKRFALAMSLKANFKRHSFCFLFIP